MILKSDNGIESDYDIKSDPDIVLGDYPRR
jgi:hypothetical protein